MALDQLRLWLSRCFGSPMAFLSYFFAQLQLLLSYGLSSAITLDHLWLLFSYGLGLDMP